MNPPRVSVIIPTYNRAALVCHAIDSVLRQHWRDFEVLVVDDGSTDDTERVLARYGNRIRYIRQEHAGVHAARNRAMAVASGEYLAPLDSDDLWEPWKLGLMVPLMDRFPDVGFAFSNFSHLNRDGSIGRDGLRRWHMERHEWAEVFARELDYRSLNLPRPEGIPSIDFHVYTGDIYRWSLAEHWVNPCSALVRVAKLEDGEKFPDVDPWSGEIEFFGRLSRRCGALFVDQETVVNRGHDDDVRLTKAEPAAQLASRIALIDRLWKTDATFMREHAPEVDRVQFPMLVRLAGLLIAQGRRPEARRALARAGSLRGGRPVRRALLAAAASIPGSGLPVQGFRRLRQAMRMRHQGLGSKAPGSSQSSQIREM